MAASEGEAVSKDIAHSAAKSGFIPGSDLSALIARLETAEAGGRELDVALAWHRWVEPKMWGSTNAKGEPVWKVERDGKRVPLPAYTSSLDAALALAERVLEERGPININVCLAGSAQAQIYPPDPCGHHVQAVGQTPAIALCIAVLKAKSQS